MSKASQRRKSRAKQAEREYEQRRKARQIEYQTNRSGLKLLLAGFAVVFVVLAFPVLMV